MLEKTWKFAASFNPNPFDPRLFGKSGPQIEREVDSSAEGMVTEATSAAPRRVR